MSIIEILTLFGVLLTVIGLVISAISLGFSISKDRKEHHR